MFEYAQIACVQVKCKKLYKRGGQEGKEARGYKSKFTP